MTGRRRHDPVVDVVDDDMVLEIFATGLTRIENHGTTSRLVFGARRRKPRGLIEVVTICVVVPTDAVPTIARQLLAGDCGFERDEYETGERPALAN